MLPRPKPALDDLPADRVIRVAEKEDPLAAIRRAIGGRFSLEIRRRPPTTRRACVRNSPNSPAAAWSTW